MKEPLVSVIIPCYNQGHFIHDAINSVLDQDYQNYEIIVVNDGSTSAETNQIVGAIAHPKVTVITTLNQGLAEARNTGIKNSSGVYILPLDADDKIEKDYMKLAVQLLNENENLGIVYGRAVYFGERNTEWKLEKPELSKLLFYNQIYASAFFRRTDYEKVGGYDKGMKYGWEDWEFWLSIIELQREIKCIDKICFYYRIVNGSMVRSMTDEHRKYLQQRVYCRHSQLYNEYFSDPLSLYGDFKYYKAELEKLRSNFVLRALISVFKKIGVIK